MSSLMSCPGHLRHSVTFAFVRMVAIAPYVYIYVYTYIHIYTYTYMYIYRLALAGWYCLVPLLFIGIRRLLRREGVTRCDERV